MIFELGRLEHSNNTSTALQLTKQVPGASSDQANNATANITAIFVHDEEPPKHLSVLMDHMKATGKWATLKLTIDPAIALAFRCIKLPSLLIYNSQNEETARVYGEQNIHDLLQKMME